MGTFAHVAPPALRRCAAQQTLRRVSLVAPDDHPSRAKAPARYHRPITPPRATSPGHVPLRRRAASKQKAECNRRCNQTHTYANPVVVVHERKKRGKPAAQARRGHTEYTDTSYCPRVHEIPLHANAFSAPLTHRCTPSAVVRECRAACRRRQVLRRPSDLTTAACGTCERV